MHSSGLTLGVLLAAHAVAQSPATGAGLTWSSWFDASSNDTIEDIAVDSQGHVVIVGYTQSNDFPTTPGAWQTVNRSVDAFVVRLTADGTTLISATLLGGAGIDRAHAVAIDPDTDDAIVVGFTQSNDFPATLPPIGATNLGTFVAAISPDGTARQFGLVFGPSSGGRGVAVDSTGIFVVGGGQQSGFPTTAGAFAGLGGSADDAYVVKLSRDASQLLFAGMIGGVSSEACEAIALLPDGSGIICGKTSSDDFPTTTGAIQSAPLGNRDAWVARFQADGSGVQYATRLGGGADDGASAVAVDARGRATVVGFTRSQAVPAFPTTPGALRRTIGSGNQADGFVARLSVDGTALLASTLLLGSGDDELFDLALHADGSTTVVGRTRAPDQPTTPGAYQVALVAQQAAFVARVSADASSLTYATYLSGTGFGFGGDAAKCVHLASESEAVVAGVARSLDFPVTAGAWQTTRVSQASAIASFVTRLPVATAWAERYGEPSRACSAARADLAGAPDAGDTTFALHCESAPQSASGAAFVTFGRQVPGFPILGASVLVALAPPPFALPSMADANGAATVPLSLGQVVAGTRFTTQFVWLDASCSAGGPLGSSDALEVFVR